MKTREQGMLTIRVLLMLLVLVLSSACWADSNDDLIHYSQRQQEALVVKVIASDLIVLEDGRRVKLIGIESLGPPPVVPVKYDSKGRVIEEPQPPTISLQEQAIDFAQDLLENKKVRLEYDVDPGDTHGYTYAYVFLPDGRMANAELLRYGFVKLRIIPPNIKYEDKLQQAYQEARREKRGIEDF
ncbi:MAG: thermonuclease family protein [Candidatus Omnitrophica bacterium]|nr:thermonuclease family protein [Candidatus Omnitrophota bacterium]